MKISRWSVNNIKRTEEHGVFRLGSTMSEENPHCRSRARLLGLLGTDTRVRHHAAQTATFEKPADMPSSHLSRNKDFDFKHFPFSVISSHKQKTSPLKVPLLYWTFIHRGSPDNSTLMNLLEVLRSKEVKDRCYLSARCTHTVPYAHTQTLQRWHI